MKPLFILVSFGLSSILGFSRELIVFSKEHARQISSSFVFLTLNRNQFHLDTYFLVVHRRSRTSRRGYFFFRMNLLLRLSSVTSESQISLLLVVGLVEFSFFRKREIERFSRQRAGLLFCTFFR